MSSLLVLSILTPESIGKISFTNSYLSNINSLYQITKRTLFKDDTVTNAEAGGSLFNLDTRHPPIQPNDSTCI